MILTHFLTKYLSHFNLDLKSIRSDKENVTITDENFSKWMSNIQFQFQSIISEIESKGIKLSDIYLHQITIEFEKYNKFQVADIYLTIRVQSENSHYSIRIEGCFNVSGMLFPEQLKWQEQIK